MQESHAPLFADYCGYAASSSAAVVVYPSRFRVATIEERKELVYTFFELQLAGPLVLLRLLRMPHPLLRKTNRPTTVCWRTGGEGCPRSG